MHFLTRGGGLVLGDVYVLIAVLAVLIDCLLAHLLLLLLLLTIAAAAGFVFECAAATALLLLLLLSRHELHAHSVVVCCTPEAAFLGEVKLLLIVAASIHRSVAGLEFIKSMPAI